jgi:hypothetical protein
MKFMKYVTVRLEEGINYHIRISYLSSCIDYILLRPQHVSITQDHLQGVYHIKWKLNNSCIKSKI